MVQRDACESGGGVCKGLVLQLGVDYLCREEGRGVRRGKRDDSHLLL